ncbi:hypothetical protein E2C01_007363 [Portunus trituberculatus]|uniref:Uncharacterized protein n=1 Tax=Portunus trituberculatus TaxID=210409 RepID=A0A5B7D0Y9_PORTR|nr:hypothetical protein [Portunus trituberculatus]
MDNCSFVPVTIGSLHRNKVPCRVPELVQNGSRLLFRQGSTKGIGKVIQVFEEEPDNVDIYNGLAR